MIKRTKVVNIYPSMPITTVNPPIRAAVKRVTKSVSEIRACLMARAIVDEILPDGKTIRLDISNYDKVQHEAGCQCGVCGGWKLIEVSNNANAVPAIPSEDKSAWQIAYNNAMAGKDLTSMTRKQRRSVEAAARAAADAAVASSEPEVVMGVATIETPVEPVEAPQEDVATEEVNEVETTNIVEETPEVEEEVKTDDIEDISEDAE